MEHLSDTNILVRSVDRTSLVQAEALNALAQLIRKGDSVYVTPQNLIEFWRVCTRPLHQNGLGLSPSEADHELARVERTLTLLPESPAIYPEWRRLAFQHNVSGIQVHDARLVATMNVYGVRSILTFNGRDFRRYRHLQILHPRDV